MHCHVLWHVTLVAGQQLVVFPRVSILLCIFTISMNDEPERKIGMASLTEFVKISSLRHLFFGY